MKQLTSFFKKLQLSKILTVLLAGVVLFVTTACNSGDIRGARPENPPVQAGGMNNPHKGGGDGYTNYKSSTDANIQDRNRRDKQANLPVISNQLIAASGYDSGILYPGAETPTGRIEKEKQLPKITDEGASAQIPSPRQGVLNRTNPDARILENSAEVFNKASESIKDKSDEAVQRPELKQNPALQ